MNDEAINLRISELSDGAIQESLTREMKKVFKDIHDPNTEHSAKRSITLKLDFVANEQRDFVGMTSKIKSTLAPSKEVGVSILTEKGMDGNVYANELISGAKGQMFFDDNGEIRDDKGQPVEKQEKVIDFKKEGNS